MRAILLPNYGGPEVLAVGEAEDPVAGPGQIRVRVGAAAVNPVDLSTRAGLAARAVPDPVFPMILGWDVAGVVDQVGEGVTRFAVGDRVLGMSLWFVGRRGTYAEHVVLDEGAASATPENLDDVAAATIPLNSLTAWSVLAASRLEAGQRILVTGAAGAVGGYLVELGVDRGLHVVALGRPHDADVLRSFGAHEVIDDLAACAPVDVAVDTTGNPGPYVAAVKPGGRLLTLSGRVEGDTGEVTVKGIGVRNDAAALGTIAAMSSAGKLSTRVAGTFPFEAVADAHRQMAAGGVRGRLVLVP